MRNEKFRQGDRLSLPVKADAKSGDFVLVGDQGLFGVCATDEGAGGNADGYASVWMEGVFDLPVGTTTALDIGDKVYVVTSTGALTTTDNTGANPHVGWAMGPKGTTAGEVIPVKLAKV